jgi:hypothetical protein
MNIRNPLTQHAKCFLLILYSLNDSAIVYHNYFNYSNFTVSMRLKGDKENQQARIWK